MQVYTHELGHNMGLRHAASNLNELVSTIAPKKLIIKGNYVEYGDPTAIMGNVWLDDHYIAIFTAPELEYNGWAPSEKVFSCLCVSINNNKFKIISTSGTYNISPINSVQINTTPYY